VVLSAGKGNMLSKMLNGMFEENEEERREDWRQSIHVQAATDIAMNALEENQQLEYDRLQQMQVEAVAATITTAPPSPPPAAIKEMEEETDSHEAPANDEKIESKVDSSLVRRAREMANRTNDPQTAVSRRLLKELNLQDGHESASCQREEIDLTQELDSIMTKHQYETSLLSLVQSIDDRRRPAEDFPSTHTTLLSSSTAIINEAPLIVPDLTDPRHRFQLAQQGYESSVLMDSIDEVEDQLLLQDFSKQWSSAVRMNESEQQSVGMEEKAADNAHTPIGGARKKKSRISEMLSSEPMAVLNASESLQDNPQPSSAGTPVRSSKRSSRKRATTASGFPSLAAHFNRVLDRFQVQQNTALHKASREKKVLYHPDDKKPVLLLERRRVDHPSAPSPVPHVYVHVLSVKERLKQQFALAVICSPLPHQQLPPSPMPLTAEQLFHVSSYGHFAFHGASALQHFFPSHRPSELSEVKSLAGYPSICCAFSSLPISHQRSIRNYSNGG